MQNGPESLTVLRGQTGKNNVTLLVNFNVLDAVFAPLAKQDCDFLPSMPLGDVETEIAPGGFDAEETSQPVLLDLNLPDPAVSVGPDIGICVGIYAILGLVCRAIRRLVILVSVSIGIVGPY